MSQPMSPGNAIEDDSITKDGILDLLNDESDDITEESKETKSSDKTEEKKKDKIDLDIKDDDEDDTEEDEEEKIEVKGADEDEDDDEGRADDEELDLMTPVRRKEILSKYPKLFKDFPYLERAYYREQQYTEIFPTIEDAKAVQEKSQTLDHYEAELMKGDTKSILQAVKDQDQDAFNQVVDNYLDTLGAIDSQAQFHVIGNVIKQTLITMAQEAHRLGGDQAKTLNNAAAVVNQFMFGSSEFQPPQKLAAPPDDKLTNDRQALDDERVAMLTEQFESVSGDLQIKVDNTLTATVNDHIDPHGSMSSYVKKQAVRETMETVREQIGNDKRFGTIIDSLWEKSTEQRFSQASIRKIRSVYLSKAKTLLPSAIKKVRREVLKDTGTRTAGPRQGQVTPGRSTTRQSKQSGKVPDGSGESTFDFFNRD